MFNMIADYSKLETKAVGPDDLKLVHATQNRDISAFERLVDRYHRKLLRIAHRVTNNHEDSQDVVQET
jgi:DNA-directed RNA polymerase specialized sigma24 family protein